MKSKTPSIADMMSLKRKTVLVTGGAQGIGLATALRYAEAGADIVLLDIDEVAIDKATKIIKKGCGVKVYPYRVDLSKIEAIESFWEHIDVIPDILVNNAGVFWSRKLEKLTSDDYDQMHHINTKAVVFMCKNMIMRSKKAGTIINIGSIESEMGMNNNMLAYGASKASIPAITHALTRDYTKKGWKINCVLPGGVITPGATKIGMTALKHFDFSIIATSFKFNMRLPYGKFASPDDIARVVLFLGTPMSDYMRGSKVIVDGGFLAV